MGEGKEREGHVGEQRGMGRSRASAGMNIAREGRREGKVTERRKGRRKEEEQFFILASANASTVIRRRCSLARSLSAASSHSPMLCNRFGGRIM